MPQEIRVVQCCQCKVFQVDIVKKSNKWQCKLCNAKQSLRREYFRGSGADCRQIVQELNMKKGECEAQEKDVMLDLLSEDDDFLNAANMCEENYRSASEQTSTNKWNIENENMQKDETVHQSPKRTLRDFNGFN